MKLFDTHTHYDDSAYDNDRDELIPRLLSESVAGFIAVGCNLERSGKAVTLAGKYPQAYAAVGIHPQDVENLPHDYLQTLEKYAGNKKVAAIGEIGLEYYYDGYDKNLQKKIFSEQLELAKSLNLPVIIHTREAFQDTLEILREYVPKGLRAVCHCFSEDGTAARSLAEMGVYVSFTGAVAFKKAERAVEACKNVPNELLMLETDCPYLAPPPFRGKRCDSGMAWFTAQRIAQIKRRVTDDIVEICNNNAAEFFNISL